MKHNPLSRNNQKLREKAFFLLNIVKRFDPLALWITRRVGTMSFFGIILFWTLFWLIWNTLAPLPLRFDPYPAFALWLFISNMVQIFLMPLLMIGQNLDTRRSEAKAAAHFAMSSKTEQEVEHVLTLLDCHNQLLRDFLEFHENERREMLYFVARMGWPVAHPCHENSLRAAKKLVIPKGSPSWNKRHKNSMKQKIYFTISIQASSSNILQDHLFLTERENRIGEINDKQSHDGKPY